MSKTNPEDPSIEDPQEAPVPEFFPYADVSTGLITTTDCNLLAEEDPDNDHGEDINSLFLANYKEGIFVHLCEEPEDFDNDMKYATRRGYSSKFVTLMTTLRAWGYWYVRLDADGLCIDPIEPPQTQDELARAEFIKSLVGWSSGTRKLPNFTSYKTEFKEMAELFEAYQNGTLVDDDFRRAGELIAEAKELP